MEKKLFTAQKRGETRAIYLGIGMIVCSVMMFFLLVINLLPSYKKSVWTEKSVCTLVQASFKDEISCTYGSNTECEKTSQYPCLEVLVTLNDSENISMLYHTEETPEINSECSYIPKCEKNYTEVKIHVDIIVENFKKTHSFGCFYDPEGRQKSIILIRKFAPDVLLSYCVWPASIFTGGIFIVIMVKLSHYLSKVSVQPNKLNTCVSE
ncbi:calcium-activated potassium channel subunit beta-1 isoform X2 [Ascaphus truei]